MLAGAIEYANCISKEGGTSSKECSGYDTKTSDSEVLVLELWEMCNTSSLLLLPGPL